MRLVNFLSGKKEKSAGISQFVAFSGAEVCQKKNNNNNNKPNYGNNYS